MFLTLKYHNFDTVQRDFLPISKLVRKQLCLQGLVENIVVIEFTKFIV